MRNYEEEHKENRFLIVAVTICVIAAKLIGG